MYTLKSKIFISAAFETKKFGREPEKSGKFFASKPAEMKTLLCNVGMGKNFKKEIIKWLFL